MNLYLHLQGELHHQHAHEGHHLGTYCVKYSFIYLFISRQWEKCASHSYRTFGWGSIEREISGRYSGQKRSYKQQPERGWRSSSCKRRSTESTAGLC